MASLPRSPLLRFVERAVVSGRRGVSRFSTRYSRTRFTHRQRVVLRCLELTKTTTDLDLVDERIEIPRIRDPLDPIPAPSTLWKAFDRLEMAVWRVLLNASIADSSVNGATCFEATDLPREGVPEAEIVPGGVSELVRLHATGHDYVKPT